MTGKDCLGMIFFPIFIIISIILSTQLVTSKKEEGKLGQYNKIVKAKLTLYMESMCPDCHEFVHKQLYPVFSNYSEYIELDLVPFGNGEYKKLEDGSYNFTCQHGPDECYGNIFLSCAARLMQHTADRDKLMKYFDCMATDKNKMKVAVRECARSSGIVYSCLRTCVNTEGQKIVAEFGKRTINLRSKGLKFVPFIVINDDFQVKDQDRIDQDLFKYLCKKLKGDKPKECSQYYYHYENYNNNDDKNDVIIINDNIKNDDDDNNILYS